jgi:hypothetical protein
MINQKTVIAIGLILVAVTIILWLAAGGEFFTKTQVLVEKETTEIDKLLGIPPQKEYQDKFVFGLIPAGLSASAEMISASTISGIIALLTGIFYFFFKIKKRKETL